MRRRTKRRPEKGMKMEHYQREITAGDLFSVYGTVGYIDYTIRRRLKLDAPVDGDLLCEAVTKTAARYPYFCVRLRCGTEGFYYEPNSAPVAVLHTAGSIRLASAQTNYHIWAVCYDADELYIDFFHGLADGIGVSALTETLLYDYFQLRYGGIDAGGIRTLETPISPAECADPLDALPDVPLPESAEAPAGFDIVRDGGMTGTPTVACDVIVPESAFLRFTSASDASPGTMVALLSAKAVDECFPERSKPILGHYAMNARPVLKAPVGHHNCLTAISLPYTERIAALPFQVQCTAYRGMTFLQSDPDRVRPVLERTNSMFRNLARIPLLASRRAAFNQVLTASCDAYTYVVSYTGQWKRPALAQHIREFWTHAPGAMPFVVEIKSISGNLFLSILRSTKEDDVERAFLHQLTQNGIPYTVARNAPNDIAAFPGPEELG